MMGRGGDARHQRQTNNWLERKVQEYEEIEGSCYAITQSFIYL